MTQTWTYYAIKGFTKISSTDVVVWKHQYFEWIDFSGSNSLTNMLKPFFFDMQIISFKNGNWLISQ